MVRELIKDKYGVDMDERRTSHKDVVERALKAGAPVPKNVLKDYPNLK